MRKLFWMIMLFSAYLWVSSSGKQQFFLDQGRAVCGFVASWFNEAEVDFQVKKETKPQKKRSRRWD